MPLVIKKLFGLKRNKQALILLGLIAAICLLAPLEPAHAWTEWLNPLNYFPAILNLILQLILLILGVIMGIVAFFLKVAFSSSLFPSFTSPTDNPIIRLGWPLMRDLVNTALILAFAYIGLATALNISGFNTKKTFANVLIVALLVNFTPVICGVIVDISNMLTGFFLQNADFSTFCNNFNFFKGGLPSNGRWTDASTMLSLILLIAYAVVGIVVMALYFLLFLIRHFMIWILVVFSPLAFLAWALRDASSKIATLWNKWWDMFLQWSFIAVPAAFFLYLSQQVLAISPDKPLIHRSAWQSVFPGYGGLGADFFAPMAPSMMAMVLMGVGFVATLQINALGAGAVVGLGKKATEWGKAKGKTLAKEAPRFMASRWAGGFVEGVKGGRAGTGWKGKIKGALVGFGKGTAYGSETVDKTIEKGKEKTLGLLEKAHLIRPGAYERAKATRYNIGEAESRLKSLSTDRLKEIAKRRAIGDTEKGERAAAVRLLAQRSKFEFDDPDQEKEIIQKTLETGADLSDLRKSRPDLTPEIDPEKLQKEVDKAIEELRANNVVITAQVQTNVKEDVRRDLIRHQIERMTPRQFRESVTQDKVLKNTDVFTALDTQKIRDLGYRGSTEQRRALRDAVSHGSQSLQDIIQRVVSLRNRREWYRRKGMTDIAKEYENQYIEIANVMNDIKQNPNF